jgi:hypothetical protein
MKAFSEKGDLILLTLNILSPLSWDKFTQITKIDMGDGVLIYLKDYRGFISYNDAEILITDRGHQFISTTSFVEQRNNRQET